jgi:NAD(P)-dependent dehydrogenase (short-subunit alcohol dehydrogenase family)/acyl carrier protein
VAGPCQIIPREYPAISCREIDIVLPMEGAVVEGKALDQLLTELLLAPATGLVAYRGGHRWTPALETVRLDRLDGTTAPLREEGVYLITGGLGGIGLTLAEHLARSVHARLVLVGRSRLPERELWEDWLASHDEQDETCSRIRRVQALEGLGAEVVVASADVTKLDQMTEAVRQTQERFGALHGVIHAAGLPGAGVIQLKTPTMAAAVLAPKVLGTLVLDAALRSVELDFFMLCSSISAIVAPMGQVDYCSANAFLDAYANAAAAEQGRHVVAINWDAWRDVGMAAAMELPADLQAERARQVAEGISPAEGSLLFHRILCTALPQVIVSTRDLQALAEYAADETSTAGLDGRVPTQAQVKHNRPVLPTTYVAPTTAVEQIIADQWQDLLGVDKVGIHDDFFELGGHSLLAIQFLSRLRATLQVDLSMRAIFDSSTVAQLAARIEDGTVPAATDDGIVGTLAQIEQLSDEEVQRLLAQVDRPS